MRTPPKVLYQPRKKKQLKFFDFSPSPKTLRQRQRKSSNGGNVRRKLKKFAPLRTTNVAPNFRHANYVKVANEGDFQVERMSDYYVFIYDIFDPYYKSNPGRHHVWTDNLVIRAETEVANVVRKGAHVIKWKQLKRFNLECLDDPEKHFYLKKIDEQSGYGLFAKHAIPANTVIGEYTGELISREEFEKRQKELKKTGASNYFFSTYSSMTIDAGAMGNHTRFLNHGSGDRLNCRTQYVDLGDISGELSGIPRNFIISTRAIAADEQLFIWYGKGYFGDEDCLCGSDNEECMSKFN